MQRNKHAPTGGGESLAPASRASRNWLAWLTGIAVLGIVIIVTLNAADAPEILRLLRQVEAQWLVLAAAAQALSYLSEAQVWRSVTRAAGVSLPLWTAYRLSLAKLFIDQAIPTGGLSGALVCVVGLRQNGISRSVAISGVVVDTFSYYSSYAMCVVAALVVAAARDSITGPLAAIAALFAIVSAVFATAVLLRLGSESGPLRKALERGRLMQRVLSLLRDIDPRLAHDPRVLSRAIAWQLSIQLLDAITLWLLLLALGATVDLQIAFSSYMFSALFRTISFSPGGLGTFEAASVVILHTAGVPLEAGLSATLLFRVLNFWLPMLPGIWFARRVARHRGFAFSRAQSS